MPTNESLDERLTRFHRETIRAVAPPGPAAVRRTVQRRQRRRVAIAGVAAVLAIASAIGVAQWVPTRVSPINPDPSASVSHTPGSPSPSSSPSASPSSSPSSSSAPSASAPPNPTTAAPGPVTDLHVSGPSSVTLASDGTVYRGQFNLTITNSGPPYTQSSVYLTLPNGVDIDYQAGNPGFGTCVRPPTPETWVCYASSIPSGGRINTTVHVVAQYAPRSTELVIPGFAVRYEAANGTDPTPADNTVTMQIVLPAA